MRSRRRKNTKLLLVLLILGITVGFALLSQTLGINGISGINKNTWNIHWDRTSVAVNPNSVESETPIVKGTNDNTVEFSTVLELPGEFFEFTVDAINEGTVDGTITLTTNQTIELIDEEEQVIDLPDYIKYTVTYDDGEIPTIGDVLKKQTSQKYKVRVEFDPEATTLPDQTKEFKFRYTVTYEQYKDDPTKPYTVTFNPNGGTVSPTTKSVPRGEKIGELPVPENSGQPFLGWYTGITEGTKISSNTIPTKNVTYYAHWAESFTMFDTGKSVNTKFKTLAGDTLLEENPWSTADTNITTITRSTTAPPSGVTTEIVSVRNQPEIYAWFDNGTIYWYTESKSVYLNEDAEAMFSNYKNLTSIDTSFYTTNTTNMKGMFSSLPEISTLDLSNFDTSNVTNMNTMFASSSFDTLDLSNFDTSNVTDMGTMFASTSVPTLDLSSFDTSNVTDMSTMFASSNIPTLNLSKWDTSSVTNMSTMFAGSKVTNLDLKHFDTSKVENFSSIFSGAQLVSLDISGWDFSKTTSINYIFSGDTNLETLILKDVNTTNVESMSAVFSGCTSLTDLDLSSFDIRKVTNINGLFSGCSNLKNVNISGWNFESLTSMAGMFASLPKLETIDFTNVNTSNITSMSGLFNGSYKIQSLDMSSFDVSNVTTFGLFGGNSEIKTINISGWNFASTTSLSQFFSAGLTGLESIDFTDVDTSNITNMYQMFAGCSSIKSLDLSSWDTSKVTDMTAMFAGMPEVTTIVVGDGFKTGKVNSSSAMFSGDVKLVGGLGTEYDSNHIDKLYARYDKAELKPGYFNAGEVTFHTVTFNANGGETDTETIRVIDGLTIKEMPTATRTGMDFRGWYTGITDGLQVTTDTKITEDITLYAHWYSDVNITYNANTGSFEDNETSRSINYGYSATEVTRYAHTPNINDSGVASDAYSNNMATNQVITIPGASQLNIEVWFSTESAGCDWLAIYPAGVTPDQNNYSQATISGGKLAGHGSYSGSTKPNDSDTTYHRTFTADGDTVQFFFRTDGSVNYYGYYAIVTGTGKGFVGDKQYKEPTKENNRFIGWNTKQDGIGKSFANETEVTEYIDNAHNNMNLYAQWEETVTVTFDGNGGTVQDNLTRTIKKGDPVGDLPNATKSNNAFTGWHTGETEGLKINKDYVPNTNITVWAHWTDVDAMFDAGQTVNVKFKTLAGDTDPTYSSNNTTILAVKRSTTEPTEENKTEEHVVSYAGSKVPIYAWFDNGTIYWWSQAAVEYTFYDAQYMFAGLTAATEIDTTFDTSLTQNSPYMFYNDSSLTTLEVGDFNTSNISNIGSMFSGCSQITSMDLSKWDTRNMANMQYAFASMPNLNTLNLSNWKFLRYAPSDGYLMSKLSSYGFSGLKTLIMDNAVFPANMYYGFYNMSNLETLSLKNVDTSRVVNMSYMFSNDSKISVLDLSDFDTSNVTDMSYMFYYCQGLTSLDLSNFNTSKVTTLYDTFYNCTNIVKLDLSSFDTRNVGNFSYTFGYMSKLEELNISNWNFSKYTSSSLMSNMGYGLNSLRVLKMDNVVFPTNMSYGLYNLSKLEEISLKNVDTSNTTNMSNLFYNDPKIKELDLGSFDTRKVTDMGSMFNSMSELTTILVSDNFEVDQVTYSSSMFYGDNKLIGGLGTKYDSSHIDKEYAHYDRGIHDPGYFDKATPVRLITLDPNTEALEIETIKTREGKEVTLPKPVWQDHVFLGWYTSLLPDGVKIENPYTVTQDITLYAKWREAVYLEITFNPNGGTVEEETRRVLENDEIGVLPQPENGDYIFLGWYTDPTAGTKISSHLVPTENMTVWARWDQCKDFATASWNDIRDRVNSDPTYYPVGCTRDIDMGTYGTQTIRISNNTTPSKCSTKGFSQTACGFVLEFQDIITQNRMNPYTNNGNTNGDGNRGGWQHSEARTLVNGDIYNALPQDLRKIIVETDVVSGYGPKDSSNFDTKDKLYLLSPKEIYNTDGSSYNFNVIDTALNSTRQLDYYYIKDVPQSNNINGQMALETIIEPNVSKKYNGELAAWWLRTPSNSGSDDKVFQFMYVLHNGGLLVAENQYPDGISPAFRIGNSYTVTFDPNGGEVSPTEREIIRGKSIEKLPTPTREGYGFAGWYTKAEDGEKIDDSYKPNKDITLYAHWQLDKVITYDANNGKFDEDATTNVETYKYNGTPKIVYSHTPNIDDNGTADGYHPTSYRKTDVVKIDGAEGLDIEVWYSTGSSNSWLAIYPAGVTPTYSNYSQATISGGKLYGGYSYTKASATHKIYRIKGDTAQFFFNSDYSSAYYGYYAIIKPTKYTTNDTYKEPTRDEHRFDGWTKDQAGNGTLYRNENAVINALDSFETNDTLYAKWYEYEKYTITLNPNGGTVDPTTVQGMEDHELGFLPTPEKSGSAFLGWYTLPGGQGQKIEPSFIPSSDITIYANWNDCHGFETDSWETIQANVSEDPGAYPLGCTKDVDMGSLGTHKVRVINNSIADDCSSEGYSQTACGFTLEFIDILNNRLMRSVSFIDTKEGWSDSRLRAYLNEDLINNFPTNLKEMIVNTTVASGHGAGTTSNYLTSDKLFVPSTKEVGLAQSKDSATSVTRTFDYYTINKSAVLKKYNDTYSDWWLRSVVSDNERNMYIVGSDGKVTTSINENRGVSPAFRIVNIDYKIILDAGDGEFEDGEKIKTFDLDNTKRLDAYVKKPVINNQKCRPGYWYDCNATTKHDPTKYYKDSVFYYFADHNESVYNKCGYDIGCLTTEWTKSEGENACVFYVREYPYEDNEVIKTPKTLCRAYLPVAKCIMYDDNLHLFTPSGGHTVASKTYAVGGRGYKFEGNIATRNGYTLTGWSTKAYNYLTQGEIPLNGDITDQWIIDHYRLESNIEEYTDNGECGSARIYATWRSGS